MLLNGKFDWSVNFLIIVVRFLGQFSATREVAGCRDGNVRLAGGSSNQEGIVEVCRNEEWGRVCDDEWDINEATVVCSQLGLPEEGAIVYNNFTVNNHLPIVLDDLGCVGNETNLLECLPQHNCQPREMAGVKCSLRGARLEHNGVNIRNNSLVRLDDIGRGSNALLCVTDKTPCCDEADGNWYLPDGTPLQSDTNLHNLYVSREDNQTVRLNNNMTDVNASFGIYFCGILDRPDNINYLYVGIYPPNKGNITNVTIHYDKQQQSIVCLSKGGPATTVTWSLNNDAISTNGQNYEASQTIVDTTSALYENRLRIIDKTSAMAGVYRCVVSNPMGSLYTELDIQVCRDMELRVNSDSNAYATAEVCIDDQWHSINSPIHLNDRPPRNIAVNINTNAALLTVKWQSPSSNAPVDHYDTFCTTITTNSGQYQMIKVGNLSPDIRVADINLPMQSATYNCCVTAYIRQPSLQLLTASTACVSLSTSAGNSCISSQYTIGFGSALGFMILFLPIACLVCLCIVLSFKSQVKPTRKARPLDPEDMLPNPIYDSSNDAPQQGKREGTSSPEPSASATPRYASTDDLIGSTGKSVAENPQYSTTAGVAYYEIIDDLPTKKPKESDRLQAREKANTQIYYNVAAKRDDTVMYCNTKF